MFCPITDSAHSLLYMDVHRIEKCHLVIINKLSFPTFHTRFVSISLCSDDSYSKLTYTSLQDQMYYWTDVKDNKIYRSSMSGLGTKEVVVQNGLVVSTDFPFRSLLDSTLPMTDLCSE